MADDNEDQYADVPSLPQQTVYPDEPTVPVNTVQDITPSGVPDVSMGADYAQRGLPQVSEASPAALPIEGSPLSPEEENFWRANPNGAVVDYTTGNLVGLGDRQPGHVYSDQGPYYVNTGLGPPAVPTSQGQVQQPQQSFQPVQPRILNESDFTDPLVQNRLDDVRQQMADSANRLRGLSTASPRRGQPSPYHIELDRLNHLQSAEQTLVRQLHATAQQRLTMATENQRIEQATQHANTGAQMMGWASSIDPKQYPLGSQERNALIGQQYAQHPEWLMAQEHNPELAKNMNAVLFGSGRVQKQVQSLQQMTEAKRQSDLAGVLAKQGVTPQQFAQRSKVEAGTYDAKGNFTGADSGPHTRVTIGNQSFGITTPQFNALNQLIPSVQPQQNAQPQATPQPAVARTIFKDANGNRAYRNPDGTFEPIQ